MRVDIPGAWPYVDCQGLAGAWTLGTVQTGGFRLVHRASLKGGFGDKAVDSNRHLLWGNWEQDPGENHTEWEPTQAAYLNGTPPCSGFSLLNVAAATARKAGKDVPATARGADSAINSCMKELVRYAARCIGGDEQRGPEIVSFESVQGAGKEGRGLMQTLRQMLEEGTGQTYGLSHVFMSGSTVGSAQMRHRYYVVFHRVPFGVDPAEPRRVATYGDALADLAGHAVQWEPQEWNPPKGYDMDDAWWLVEHGIRTDGAPPVEDHMAYGGEGDRSLTRKIYLDELVPIWKAGEKREDVMRRYIELHGSLPKGAEKWWDHENQRERGFGGPTRIRPDRPGYVLTGAATGQHFHWSEERYLTVRECARLMGYPDTWSFKAASGVGQASLWIGKCCPVQSGRWISDWVLRALDREPGSPLETIGDNEYYYNNTLDYKRWPREITKLPDDFR